MSFNNIQSPRSVHNFWTALANALPRSLLDVPKLLEARILRQPLASIPSGTWTSFSSNCCLSISLLIYWTLTGWISSEVPLSQIYREAVLPFGCFGISFESVYLFSGNILLFPYCLSVSLMLNWCCLSPFIV